MLSPTFITHGVWSLNTANMSSLILLTSCIYNIILSVPFKLLFVSDAAKNAYKNIMNDEESNYKA